MFKNRIEPRLDMKRHSRGTGWVAVQFLLLALQFTAAIVKRRQWRSHASPIAGTALLAVAAAYVLPGVRSLGKNLTPLPEPKTEGELVTTGVYSHVRHPIYASLMAAGFGWALLWRSWPALFLAAVQAVFLREKAIDEEMRLNTRFSDYAAYASRVPRFVPRLLATPKNADSF